MEDRHLKPTNIPSTLWDSAKEVLILPCLLATAYEEVVRRHGLYELALTRDNDDPPVGGLDQERTNKHFAQAFDGSCARAQLAVLDPKNEVPHASNAFILRLAGNATSITDAPCGAGAAAFSFLATIAELRAQGILPRQPLQVHLIGAELSKPARFYAKEILAELQPQLERQAIYVDAVWLEWDVTIERSNASLIREMTLAGEDKAARLVVVANFNGFLEKDRKRKEAEPQLRSLFIHASLKESLGIWIEPAMNRATEGLFPWVRDLLRGAWRLFARESGAKGVDEPVAVSRTRYQLPLAPDKTARVGLAVMAFELRRVK